MQNSMFLQTPEIMHGQSIKNSMDHSKSSKMWSDYYWILGRNIDKIITMNQTKDIPINVIFQKKILLFNSGKITV